MPLSKPTVKEVISSEKKALTLPIAYQDEKKNYSGTIMISGIFGQLVNILRN